MSAVTLKCPKCATGFEAQPDENHRVVCPHCSASLRLRPKQDPQPGRGPVHSAGDMAAPPPPPPPQVAVSETGGDDKDVTLAPGTRLGGFEIKRVLGRGGMSTVYKGIQLSLNRPVAIKLLATRFASNQVFVQRFDREAGALAGLSHPNIVNIIDKGVEGDKYFFVMEYVEGITLDQLLQAVELTERHYIHLISEIAKAMTYVHGKGIIHRDIKPSNILVDKPGNVKVSDFGIAHITEGDAPSERFGRSATVGTLNYMAPEQASNPGAVDARADIYSLGVTFYKMLTKQLPSGEWKPPSMLNPSLPRSIDAVLARSLQPDPNDRYPSVREFCDELLEIFTPTAARSASNFDAAAALAPGGVGAFSFGGTIPSAFNVGTGAGEGTDATGGSSSSLFVPGVTVSDSSFVGATPAPGNVPSPRGAAAEEDDEKSGKLKLILAIAAGVLLLVGAGVGGYIYFVWS